MTPATQIYWIDHCIDSYECFIFMNAIYCAYMVAYSFQELKVWQESRILVRHIREICKRPNVSRDYSFIDQITRAARSVSANIAEGNDSMTIPEFIQYLGISKRSTAEVHSHLFDALDEKYISKQEFNSLSDLCRKICGMLAKFIHQQQSLDATMKRTFSQRKGSEY